jgi:indolepyruvate ferredoxin oxidoreductase
MERALVGEYRELVGTVLAQLNAGNYDTAVALANLPEKIRGFGHVKEKAVAEFRAEKARLLAAFNGGQQHAA